MFNKFKFKFKIFSQEEYSPYDPSNLCANYPTEEFDSYADCDDNFVRRTLPPGLKPFWTVDNISEATETFTMNSEEYSRWFYDYGKVNSTVLQYCCILQVLSSPGPINPNVFFPA